MPENLVELKRLARVEPKRDDFPLTKFLSLCHRQLKAQGIRFVVAFSDPAEGHRGGIYRAANFRYLGLTEPEWHVVDAAGTRRHRKVAYRAMQRANARGEKITLDDVRERLGLRRVKTVAKDRWLIDLGASSRKVTAKPQKQQAFAFDVAV